jgi:hypothetical protein
VRRGRPPKFLQRTPFAGPCFMEAALIDPRMMASGSGHLAGSHLKHVYERETGMFHGSALAARPRTEEGTG